MAPGIGASGVMGIALETVSGTYTPPTKFVPFDSESLNYQQDTVWRRPIRNTPGIVGALAGNSHVAGDITMDAEADIVPYFLLASRTSVTKVGASAPFTYTFKPTAAAVPVKTLSVTIVKNGIVFGFTGVVVNTFSFTTDSGILKFNVGLLGRDEAVATVPTPVWPTSVPFGAGSYNLSIPTATQVFDADTITFAVDNGGDPQFRLKNTGRGAQFIKFGEMASTMTMERDFESRTQFDAYKALTAQDVTFAATSGAEIISIHSATAIVDSYTVSLGGQGDLVRASVSYQCVIDATGKNYDIAVTTAEVVPIT